MTTGLHDSVRDEQPHGGLSVLTPGECLQLLASRPVGRLAIGRTDGPPIVLPVNFVVAGHTIVFRSNPGTKTRLIRGTAVSFQVDWIDDHHHEGWSVLAHGIAEVATDWEVENLAVHSWMSGDQPEWMRVVITAVSGRRLSQAQQGWAADDRGYL